MKHSEIGIDMGEFEFKLAYVERIQRDSGKAINSVMEAKSYRTKGKMYSEEYFASLKNSIKDFSKIINKKHLSLNFAVPYGRHTELLNMVVPKAEEKDVTAGLKFEVEQEIGHSISKHKTLWRKVENLEDKKMKVLFSSIDSRIISSISKFKTINWKVNKIILQPVVLERFAKKNTVILDFGQTTSKVMLYKQGKFTAIETIPYGAKNVKEKMKEYIGAHGILTEAVGDINESEVVNMNELLSQLHMTNKYISSEIDNELIENVSKYIEPDLIDLIEQVKKIIRAFEVKNAVYIDDIHSNGGLFNYNYLAATLSSELEVNVVELSTVSRETPEIKYEIASLVAVPFAVNKDEKLNFNQFARTNIDFSSIAFGVATVALSTGLILSGINSNYDKILDRQADKLSIQSATTLDINKQTEVYKQSIQKSNDFIDVVNKVTGENNTLLATALDVLPKITPLTVTAKSVTITDRNIHIEGYSSNYSSIGFFAKELEKYGEVTVKEVTNKKTTTPTYSVIAKDKLETSDKFIATKNFTIDLQYSGQLIKRGE